MATWLYLLNLVKPRGKQISYRDQIWLHEDMRSKHAKKTNWKQCALESDYDSLP